MQILIVLIIDYRLMSFKSKLQLDMHIQIINPKEYEINISKQEENKIETIIKLREKRSYPNSN